MRIALPPIVTLADAGGLNCANTIVVAATTSAHATRGLFIGIKLSAIGRRADRSGRGRPCKGARPRRRFLCRETPGTVSSLLKTGRQFDPPGEVGRNEQIP